MTRSLRAQLRASRADIRFVHRLYWWAFIVRGVVGVLAYVLTEYADISLLQDALYYEAQGYDIAREWLAGRSSDWLDAAVYGGREAWLIVAAVAIFYFVLQGVRATVVLIVVYAAAGAVVPVYTYRIAIQLGASEMVARKAAWLVALSPAFVFWSGALYKEGLILFILNLSVYHALRLQTQWQGRSLVMVVFSTFALLGLRFYLAIMMSVVIVGGLLWGRRDRTPTARARVAVPVLIRQGLIALAFVVFMISLGFTERAERPLLETDKGILVQLDKSRKDLATRADSGYLADAEISEPGDAVRLFPVGLVYFLTVPLPWQVGGLRQTLAMPETAFWILLYPLVLVGITRGLRANRPGTMLILAVTSGMCAIYGVLSGNVGIAYRMRTQVWLLWAPFAAWGWEAWQQRRAAPARRRARVKVAEG